MNATTGVMPLRTDDERPTPILVVLPRRETVASGEAGAVALTVAEFGQNSAFRDRLTVVGGLPGGDFPLPYHYIDDGAVRRFGVPWPPWTRPTHRYADAVAAFAKGRGVKVIEVHNNALVFGRIARRLPRGMQLCLHLHNDPQTMPGMRTPSERRAVVARASMIYCVSDYIRNRLVEGIEGPPPPAVTLYNGVALPALVASERQKIIVFVGRLIPEKGADALIGGLRQIAGELPDWRVLIVGRLHERQQARYGAALEDLVSAWGNRLALVGFRPHAEVMRSYEQAAITLVPSLWPEPFGRVAIEAMAAGSAVIASRSGGLPEVVGEAGILIDTVTPDDLAGAILSLARDPDRRLALSHAGRARAKATFEIGMLARQLDACRERLLQRLALSRGR